MLNPIPDPLAPISLEALGQLIAESKDKTRGKACIIALTAIAKYELGRPGDRVTTVGYSYEEIAALLHPAFFVSPETLAYYTQKIRRGDRGFETYVLPYRRRRGRKWN